MSFLEWDDSLDVGVDFCNDQHRILISYMNQLYDLDEKEASFLEKLAILDKLGNSVVTHFREEEEYMQKIGFPGFAVHKAIHEDLLSKFKQYDEAFRKDKEFDAKFFGFLRLWLTAHIRGIDTKYAKHQQDKAS